MKKNITLGVLILLCIGSCRKDEKLADPGNPHEPATVVDCAQSAVTFVQPVSNETYVDMLEDSGKNILLLGNNLVEKFNLNGILMWSKKVGLLGTPQNIIQADGDNYFITSANYVVSDYTANEIYAPDRQNGNGFLKLSASYYHAVGIYDNCAAAYQKVNIAFHDSPDYFLARNQLPANNSTCQLTKINKSGDVIWNKTFHGNTLIGKSLAKTPDGYWLLLTSQCSGFYQTIKVDANGVFQDTIHAPKKGNTLTLYKITSTGDIVWQRTMNNIETPCSPYLISSDSRISMAVSDQNICINTVYDYFILDLNGNELSRRLPSVSTCNAIAPGVTSGNNYFYSFAKAKAPGLNFYTTCIQQSDASGTVQHQFFNVASGTLYASGSALFVCAFGAAKYSLDGTPLWSKSTTSKSSPLLGIPNCNDGIIYIEKVSTGLNLVKTDRNGNY